ncbi:hypothetical protein MmTuc01_1982 [Methanosarcina mazei Tuc01]|uniref:Uncharacterized protein n=1 Tax=Methanosarcina mazei Tuc01 TaxID=1236903 RepID=M1Q4R7_METMZ|nr:hypothetical protein MmTuc01_1982 [Methanosarcina mazei Tuc01]
MFTKYDATPIMVMKTIYDKYIPTRILSFLFIIIYISYILHFFLLEFSGFFQ